MKRISIIMMILSIVSKFLGFFREIVLSNAFGATAVSDAYIYAYNLPSTLFSVVIAAFVTGFIPMYTRITKENGEEVAIDFVNNVQNLMLTLAIILGFVVLIFTDFFLSFLVPGASAELLTYLVPFMRLTIFTLIFICVIQIQTGFLQIKNAFVFPVLLSIPLNIVLISAIFIAQKTDPIVLPIGILLAYFVQAILILWYAGRRGFKFKFKIDLKDKYLRTMMIIAVPLIIGSASTSVGALVNQALASGVEGGISYIAYAQKIGGMIEGIFGVAIVSVMYPSLSKAVADKDYKKAGDEFENALASLLLFIVPCAVGMVVLSQPIVEFIYMRGGEFGQVQANNLAPVFRMYSIGLIAFSAYALMTRVYYSFQDTKTPMFTSIGIISVQVVLGLLLRDKFGLQGITLSISIANTLGFIFLLLHSRKLFKDLDTKKMVLELIKIFGSALIMGAVAFYTFGFFSASRSSNISLIIAIAIAAVIYLGLLLILKVGVLQELVNSFKKKRA